MKQYLLEIEYRVIVESLEEDAEERTRLHKARLAP